MTTADFIREHDACREGAKWALSISDNMADVWDALVEQSNHDWLFWVATRPGVFPDSTLRKLACRFVRETPVANGRTAWDLLDDDRSRKAVYVAEAYADGKATEAELDAAWTAAYAAADAAARAARAAYFAARAAASAAYSAAYAANAAACAAGATDAARVDCAAYAAYDAALAARDAANAAKSAQVKMIAELGNPFKKGADK